jgi:hypothetical protein
MDIKLLKFIVEYGVSIHNYQLLLLLIYHKNSFVSRWYMIFDLIKRKFDISIKLDD